MTQTRRAGAVEIASVEVAPLMDGVGLLGELAELYPETPADAWEPYRALYPELFAGTSWRLFCTCYLIRSGGRTVLVDTGAGPAGLGDAAAHPALLDEPDRLFASDWDHEQAAATRRALVEELVDTDVLAICGHYSRSGIGHVSHRDGRVVWEEAA